MTRISIRRIAIDEGSPVALWITGFVSSKSAHAHLFKHVIRIYDLPRRMLKTNRDPERWAQLIPDPPLKTDLSARRRAALKRLAKIPGCAIGKGSTPRTRSCKGCTDPVALDAVDTQFGDLLHAYLDTARAALAWAVQNLSSGHPFLLAYRQDGYPRLRVKALDSRKVVVIGTLEQHTGEVRLLSCFRLKPPASLKSMRLELYRESAGHRRLGSLAMIHVAPGGEGRDHA